MEKSKTAKERRRIWRKLHLAVDSNTYEIICADLSLNNVTDSEAFRVLSGGLYRKIQGSIGRRRLRHSSVTMNCGVKKSARLSRPKARVTGQ